MSRKQQTKQGMAAIYIVVFTTMLLGIVTLSFIRIMMSESDRTSKDFLAESAYNSAMAGVEDAKALLLKYYQCQGVSGNDECTKIKKKFIDDSSVADRYVSTRSCDLGSDAEDGEKTYETLIKHSSDSDSVSEQAYTCVNISLEGNYKAELTEDNPVSVVPLRPDPTLTSATAVKFVRVTITRPKDDAAQADPGNWIGGSVNKWKNESTGNYNIGSKTNAGVLGAKGIRNDELYTEKNALDVMLIQTRKDDWISEEFYAASIVNPSGGAEDNQTNRAKVMLLPTTYTGPYENYEPTKISAYTLAYSASKQYNSPIALNCDEDACIADLELPHWVGGPSTERDPNTFFLVLSSVYSQPNIKVTVSMYDGNPQEGKNEINFFNVQPIIDSTGRAGDLMRRVETRVQFANGEALVPGAELSVTGDVKKDFYVTKNCIAGTSSCPDSGEN